MSTPDNIPDGVPSVPSIDLAPEYLGGLSRSDAPAVDGMTEQGNLTGSTEQYVCLFLILAHDNLLYYDTDCLPRPKWLVRMLSKMEKRKMLLLLRGTGAVAWAT